ncbi:MAG: O-antigen ligase family protein [Candidatus Daviesbacteria bacterium]|nr:O-antigen ligase family protein [Candidatus Daviesbacteria bacterium]
MLFKLEKILLFLTVLFLPTQLGLHFWPEFSYVYSLKIDYLSPTLYFWDILAIGLLIVWALRKPHINKIALNLFLLFLFSQALSLFGASNIGAGLVRLEQYTIAGFFGVYLASYKLQVISNKLYWPLILAVLFEAILATLQFVKGGTLGLWILGERTFSISTPAIAKFDFYGRQFLRPYATFPHPNVLAGFMLIVIAILSFRRRVVNWIPAPQEYLLLRSGAFAGMTILLAVSRAAILAGFGLGLMLLNRKWKIILILVGLFLSPVLFTRFSSLLNFDNLTLLRREELMGNAWQMFTKSPIFGIGLNNFIPAQASDLIVGPNRFLQPVHNIILLTLSETGIIGLIGLISLIGFPFLRLFRLNPKPYTLYPWAIILFLGMFDHYFLTLPQGYRLLFLVWGLSFSVVK